MKPLVPFLITAAGLSCLGAAEPGHADPPPAWAIGQADRSPDLSALPGFQNPSPCSPITGADLTRGC